jgi:two-component system chemotaxis response regulator CheY
MRAFLVAALESQGYEVVVAKSGFEALKIIPREPFQLVITDINMPDINGLELVRFLRENQRHKQTPLIIISTDGRERDRERGLKLGASHYLVKPVSPETLLSAVRECLAPSAG